MNGAERAEALLTLASGLGAEGTSSGVGAMVDAKRHSASTRMRSVLAHGWLDCSLQL